VRFTGPIPGWPSCDRAPNARVPWPVHRHATPSSTTCPIHEARAGRICQLESGDVHLRSAPTSAERPFPPRSARHAPGRPSSGRQTPQIAVQLFPVRHLVALAACEHNWNVRRSRNTWSRGFARCLECYHSKGIFGRLPVRGHRDPVSWIVDVLFTTPRSVTCVVDPRPALAE
jgi:hypothetical protein